MTLSSRSVNVRGAWGRAVDAGMDDNLDELDAVWDETVFMSRSTIVVT